MGAEQRWLRLVSLMYWTDRMVFMSLGLPFCPIRTYRAFERGRGYRDFLGLSPEDLLASQFSPSQRQAIPRPSSLFSL